MFLNLRIRDSSVAVEVPCLTHFLSCWLIRLRLARKQIASFFFFFFFFSPTIVWNISLCGVVTGGFQEYFSWGGVTEGVPYVVQMDFQILPLAELLKESFIVEEFPKVLNLFWCTAFQQKWLSSKVNLSFSLSHKARVSWWCNWNWCL